ncbi:hypothetical protein FBY55_1209 [Zymomonas mobilis]|nr:hypothetical protein FBY55_1209 [Zymomonas mobilis]
MKKLTIQQSSAKIRERDCFFIENAEKYDLFAKRRFPFPSICNKLTNEVVLDHLMIEAQMAYVIKSAKRKE